MARVVWITGLPGSGKTTLAKLLRNELKNIGELCVLIDGDEIRSILGNELGYDRRTRESLANIYQNFIEFFILIYDSCFFKIYNNPKWIYHTLILLSHIKILDSFNFKYFLNSFSFPISTKFINNFLLD